MDEEIYQLLMGDTPSMEMSKALRKQKARGQYGMLTGDRVLNPVGKQMYESADSQAWKDTQLDMSKRSVLARALEAKQNREWEAEQNRLNRANRLQAANISASKKGRRFGVRDVERLGSMVDEAEMIGNVAAGFEDDYAGTTIPGGRAAANWLAANVPVLASEDAEAAQKWWATWDRVYTLPVRNKLFGSALTTQEQEAWEKANIGPNMSAKQIRENTGIITRIQKDVAARLGQRYKATGFDPDEVDSIFGSPETAALPSTSKGSRVGQVVTGADGKKYRILDDSDDPEVEPVE